MSITQSYDRLTVLREDGEVLVWRGRHRQLESDWIIKQLGDGNPRRLDGCLLEAKRWAGVAHDRLVRIVHADRAERVIVLESLANSAADKIGAGPSSMDCCVVALRGGLEGLRALHERALLHLNIKPANVLFDVQNRVKLADGRCLAIGSRQTLPPPGEAAKYLAPELFDDAPQFGTPADLYSLGFVVLEMLVGPAFSQHFQGARGEQFKWHVWHQTRAAESLSTRRLAPDAPQALAEVLDRLLLKSPTQRYQRAEEVLVDLRRGFPELAPDAPRVFSGGPSGAAARALEVVLRLLSGPRAGEEIRSGATVVRVGADDKCQVRLDPQQYPGIAKRPVELRREAEGWVLDNLGCSGVRVDGGPGVPAATMPLRSGAIVRLSLRGPDFQFLVPVPGAKSLAEIAEQYRVRSLEPVAPPAPPAPVIGASTPPPNQSATAPAPPQPLPTAPPPRPAPILAAPIAPAPTVPPNPMPSASAPVAPHASMPAAAGAVGVELASGPTGRTVRDVIDPRLWSKNTRNWVMLAAGLMVIVLVLLGPSFGGRRESSPEQQRPRPSTEPTHSGQDVNNDKSIGTGEDSAPGAHTRRPPCESCLVRMT